MQLLKKAIAFPLTYDQMTVFVAMLKSSSSRQLIDVSSIFL